MMKQLLAETWWVRSGCLFLGRGLRTDRPGGHFLLLREGPVFLRRLRKQTQPPPVTSMGWSFDEPSTDLV